MAPPADVAMPQNNSHPMMAPHQNHHNQNHETGGGHDNGGGGNNRRRGHERIHSDLDLAELDLPIHIEPLEVVINPEPDDIHLTTLEEALQDIAEDARFVDDNNDVGVGAGAGATTQSQDGGASHHGVGTGSDDDDDDGGEGSTGHHHHHHNHHKRHNSHGSDLAEALTAAVSQARLNRPDSVSSFASVVAFVDTVEPITGEEVKAHVVLTWEPEIAQRVIDMANEAQAKKSSTSSPNKPFMVAMVGIPGSGKSTSSGILSSIMDEYGIENVVMPFDGYHYPLETLKNNKELFPNSDDAVYRRGAPDTFDVCALKKDLGRIRNGDESVIDIPGFDHAEGDPKLNQHTFDRTKHNIVITEGLYLLNDDPEWESVRDYFDYCIFVHSDIDRCMARLKERNKVIPGYTEEEIVVRVDAVDRVNAETVMKSKGRANVVVDSAILFAPAEDDHNHHYHNNSTTPPDFDFDDDFDEDGPETF